MYCFDRSRSFREGKDAIRRLHHKNDIGVEQRGRHFSYRTRQSIKAVAQQEHLLVHAVLISVALQFGFKLAPDPCFQPIESFDK